MGFVYTIGIDKYIIKMNYYKHVYGGKFIKIMENHEILKKEYRLMDCDTTAAYCVNEEDAKRVIEFLNALLIAEKLTK